MNNTVLKSEPKNLEPSWFDPADEEGFTVGFYLMGEGTHHRIQPRGMGATQ